MRLKESSFLNILKKVGLCIFCFQYHFQVLVIAISTHSSRYFHLNRLIPEPTAWSPVPGVTPGRKLLILHSEVQSHPACHGRIPSLCACVSDSTLFCHFYELILHYRYNCQFDISYNILSKTKNMMFSLYRARVSDKVML